MGQEIKTENITEYDKQKLFDEKIMPLIKEIRKICIVEKIPFCASFAVANVKVKNKKKKKPTDPEYLYDTKYVNEGILTGTLGLNLYTNHFEKYILALRGGTVLTPEQADSLKIHETISSLLSNDETQFSDYEYEEAELMEAFLSNKSSDNNETDENPDEIDTEIAEVIEAEEKQEAEIDEKEVKKKDYTVQRISNGLIFVDM